MRKTASLIVILLLSSSAYCCDCEKSSNDSTGVTKAYNQSDVVGVARVLEIILHEDSNKISNYRIVNMIVERAYKGVQKGDTIQVTAYIGGRSCGYELDKGITYLLYAYHDENLGVQTNSCTRTTIFTSMVYDPVVLNQMTKK